MVHHSVLTAEVLDAFDLVHRSQIVDATLGLGGHSLAIFRSPDFSGKILGIDQDLSHLKYSQKRLADFSDRFTAVHANFSDMASIFSKYDVSPDGLFFDLGVASPHFDDPERGFSLHHEGPLDMRMNPDQVLTASSLVNHLSKHELTMIFRNYGEESFAPLISSRICELRKTAPFEKTSELRDLVESVYHSRHKYPDRHPATKVFQALRIAVNDELLVLRKALEEGIRHLQPGGRIIVISYHSLEDRIVKQTFKHAENPCTCPPKQPFCTCGLRPLLRILTRKPIVPSSSERELNPRARSAKMRVAEKL